MNYSLFVMSNSMIGSKFERKNVKIDEKRGFPKFRDQIEITKNDLD